MTYTFAPDYYVERYHAVQQGHLIGKEKYSLLIERIRQGNPHAVLTIGLFVLTLVPLARVAFCFVLFIRERDYTYVALHSLRARGVDRWRAGRECRLEID